MAKINYEEKVFIEEAVKAGYNRDGARMNELREKAQGRFSKTFMNSLDRAYRIGKRHNKNGGKKND